MGTFFPPAVGPGPVPGLDQLLREASDAIQTVEKNPATPGYRYRGVGFPEYGREAEGGDGGDDASVVSRTQGVAEPTGEGHGVGMGGRFFSTPGLTPIPTARTPDAAGGGGGGAGGAEDTPSMFLSGLLRGSGSPETAGSHYHAASLGETPGHQLEDGRRGGGVGFGARSTRMAASGLGGPPTTGGAREAATGVGSGAAGGRATRGAGGRRVGGRLSFSSAVGADDGSGGEAATALAVGTSAPPRSQGGSRRWVLFVCVCVCVCILSSRCRCSVSCVPALVCWGLCLLRCPRGDALNEWGCVCGGWIPDIFGSPWRHLCDPRIVGLSVMVKPLEGELWYETGVTIGPQQANGVFSLLSRAPWRHLSGLNECYSCALLIALPSPVSW